MTIANRSRLRLFDDRHLRHVLAEDQKQTAKMPVVAGAAEELDEVAPKRRDPRREEP